MSPLGRAVDLSSAQVDPSIFVSLEAEVDSGSSECDDDGSDQEEFIEADPIPADREASHCLLTSALQEVNLAEGWEDFLGRAQERARKQDSHVPDDDCMENWEFRGLWRVRVVPGLEEQTVAKLFAKISQKPHPVLSIIGRASLPGWIVIETERIETVYEACSGIHSLTSHAIYPISKEEAPTYLKEPPSFEPRIGGWVRLKKWPHRHDLAYVTQFNKATMQVDVLVVPRLDLTPPPNFQKRRRSTHAWRPDKGLFDYRFAAKELGAESVSVRNSLVVFRDRCYVEGFLSLENVAFFDAEPCPTREELMWFEACTHVDRASFQRALLRTSLAEINIGDKVRIVDGQSRGLIGTVASVRNDDIDVLLPDDMLESIPRLSVRKRIVVGDEAIVIAGRSRGVSGWVVALFNDEVYLYSRLHDYDIKVDVRFIEPYKMPLSIAQSFDIPARFERHSHINAHLVGQHVMIVGKTEWKGYAGIVKSVEVNGSIIVEIQANMRAEAFKPSHLKFRAGVIVNGVDEKADLPTPRPVIPASIQPLVPSTPLPPALTGHGGSPAWDPSSRTPLLRARAHWLDSKLFQKYRMKVMITGTKPLLRDPGWKAGQYEGQVGIWVGVDEDDNVKVKTGIHNIMHVPVTFVKPLPPEIPGQKVAGLTGEHLGACFVVVSVKSGVCVLCKPEDKKKKTQIHVPVSDLASIV